MIRKPLIGLLSASTRPAKHRGRHPRHTVSVEDERAVMNAGGLPVLLPLAVDLSILDRLDGLVVCGGLAVSPQTYRRSRLHTTRTPPRAVCENHLEVLRAAHARGLPTLGLCRGWQLMAVAAGGTINQTAPGSHSDSEHAVTLAGQLMHTLGTRTIVVSPGHRQTVADPGTLDVWAIADDQTIEGGGDPRHPHWVGVQWHPEMAPADLTLHRHLIAVASRTDTVKS
jgi:putative glutamine amidotransferase